MNQPTPPPVAAASAAGQSKAQGNILLLIIAVVLGLICAGLTYTAFVMQQRQLQESMITVWVFRRNMIAGETVSPRDVKAVKRPVSWVNYFEGIVDNENNYQRYTAKRMLTRDVKEGEPLTAKMFTGNQRNNEISLPAGTRMVDLKISRNSPISSLRPTNFVDILGAFPTADDIGIEVKKVLGGCQVYEVNGIARADVSPEEIRVVRTIRVAVPKETVSDLMKAQKYTTDGGFLLSLVPASEVTSSRQNTVPNEIKELIKRFDDAERQRKRRSRTATPGTPATGGNKNNGDPFDF